MLLAKKAVLLYSLYHENSLPRINSYNTNFSFHTSHTSHTRLRCGKCGISKNKENFQSELGVDLPLVMGVDIVAPAVIFGERLPFPGFYLRPGLWSICPERMAGRQTEGHKS